MKTASIGAALAAVLALLVSGAVAQQTTTPQERNTQQNQFGQRRSTGQQFDQRNQRSRDQKAVVRASQIIGMEVKNNRDEDLGSVEDLAIDPETGRVAYAAVSMGGFLGLGDKLFAVPWDAVECRPVEGSTATGEDATHVAILDVSKEQMKDAKGFDQENWPDMANQQWRQQNDRRYQSLRSGDRDSRTSANASNRTSQQ